MCPSWNPGHLRLKASIFVWIFFFFFLKGDIFALIMLIILQVSAFPGLLQNSGIYNLSDYFLL